MKCRWCNTPRSHYLTPENAMRQNCRDSDSGYHDFISWWDRLFDCWRTSTHTKLLESRRARPNTI